MKNIGFILFISILLLSCKAKNTTDTATATDSIVSDKKSDASKRISADINFFENVLLPPKFENLKISSKIKIDTETNTLPALDATIYIENNQKVWMNLAAFFINVARGVATPDGIKAYNRTDKVYIDSDFNYLNKLLNTNFINYISLQKLLMGRTFIKINDQDFILSKNSNGFRMVSAFNQKMQSDEGIIREYEVELNYANNYDLIKTTLKDAHSNDELEVRYSEWEAFKNYRMPKNVKIIIKGSKAGQILLENTKFDDSKMNTPFSVPGNYTKLEIK